MDFHCCIIFMCMHMHVNFTRLNKIETRLDVFCLNMNLSNFQLLLLCAIFNTLPLLFAKLNVIHIRTSKFLDSGNQPLREKLRHLIWP